MANEHGLSIERFAEMIAKLDDPFAEREVLLRALGLDEASWARAQDTWSGRLEAADAVGAELAARFGDTFERTREEIASTDVGRQRLQSLDASGHTVTIVPWTNPERNASCSPTSPLDAQSKDHGGTGRGSDSEVSYSPSIWPPDPNAVSTTTGAEGDVILLHELNHADHAAHGTMDLTPRKDDYDDQEEFNSIEPDENTYRDKRGFRPRHTHKHT